VAAALKAIYTAIDAEAAEAALAEFEQSELAARYPAIAPQPVRDHVRRTLHDDVRKYLRAQNI